MAKETSVIQQGGDEKHVIEGYHFKAMSELTPLQTPHPSEHHANTQSLAEATQESMPTKPENKQAEPNEQASLENEQTAPTIAPEFIENLLKKTDQMSDNIIKLQMQIESQENEFKSRLESELANAKEKYLKEGEEKAKADYESKLNELNEKLVKSLSKLENSDKMLQDAYAKNEAELSHNAVEIAKEIIGSELDKNSGKIALFLAKELISELKSATKLEVKLNPKDYDFVKEHLAANEGSTLSILMDDAINIGSVIVQSNAGNMQTGIKERLHKLNAMLEGN